MANLTPAVMLPVQPGIYCQTWPMLEVRIVLSTHFLPLVYVETFVPSSPLTRY